MRHITLLICILLALPVFAAPPKLSIIHFDVNIGDATLIISPDGHGVLIDAGNRGRGNNPINEFLTRATTDNRLVSLDHVIVTHYDSDHLGGMDEVINGGFEPAISILDRGNTNLRRFDPNKNCTNLDMPANATLLPWGTAPVAHCPPMVTCQMVEYFKAAEETGKRQEIEPGDVITLDHGIELVTLVANAKDIDNQTEDVFFTGRRDDCAENDLSVGILLKYGDFRYLIAGDLTGDVAENVANVEQLIEDDAQDVDVYHVNHHGAQTSSESHFMGVIKPTVAIVSNGSLHGHPRRTVIEDRILALTPEPDVFATNLNQDTKAWNSTPDFIADLNMADYDGMIEISVWKRTYRIWRWRDGDRIDSPGRQYHIKDRGP